MKTHFLKNTLALAVITAGLTALPALAVQSAFFGGSNTTNLDTVTGHDNLGGLGLGDTWQTHNGPLLLNSNFAMSDFNATPQPFNPLNFSNGLGSFVNSFQLTLNNSQNNVGFRGILLTPAANQIENKFVVQPTSNPATWQTWTIAYNLLDAVSGLYQQVLFTAPTGTFLAQGENFVVNINFAGIMTNDSGWAASWDDRNVGAIPEPETYAMMLAGLGLMGFVARRRKTQNAT